MMVRHLRKLVSESLVYGLSGVVSRFMGFLLVPIYTRIFAPSDYGVMSLISTTMALVATFTVLALDNAAGRWFYDSDDTNDRKRTIATWAWCQILASSLLALPIFLVADRMGFMVTGRTEAGIYFRLTALALPLSVLSTVTTNLLRFQRRPWATVGFSLGINLLNILLTVVLVVVLRRGLTGLYVAQLISAGCGTLMSVWFLKDWIKLRWAVSARLVEMLRYALPLIPTALAFWVVDVSDRYFIQWFRTTGEVGLYQISNSIAMVVGLAASSFQQAWGPFAFSIHKQPEAGMVYANVLLFYTWTACFFGTGISVFAPEIIRLVATEQYVGAHTAVPYLAFGYALSGLYYIGSLGPSLAKTTAPIGLAFILAALLNAGLNLWLVPAMGKDGAAISTLLSYALITLYLFYRSQRLYFIPYRFGPAIGIFLFSLGISLVADRWEVQNFWIGIGGKLILLLTLLPAAVLLRILTLDQLRRLMHVRLFGNIAD